MVYVPAALDAKVMIPVDGSMVRPAGEDEYVPPVAPVITGVAVPPLVQNGEPTYETVATGVSEMVIGAVVVYELQPPEEGTVTVTVYGIPVVLVNGFTAPVFGSMVNPPGEAENCIPVNVPVKLFVTFTIPELVQYGEPGYEMVPDAVCTMVTNAVSVLGQRFGPPIKLNMTL